MDREVSRTLAELERKLHELERALSGASGGHRQAPDQPWVSPGAATAPAAPPPGRGARVIDEAGGQPAHRQPTQPAEAQPAGRAPGGEQTASAPAHGQPPGRWQPPGEPSGPLEQPPPASSYRQPPGEPPGPLEQPPPASSYRQPPGRWQPPGEPPGAVQQPPLDRTRWALAAERPASEEAIDLAELVRFRDRLERTMQELIDDYERIIYLRRAPGAPDRSPPPQR